MSDPTPEQLFQKWLTELKDETVNYNKLMGAGAQARTKTDKTRIKNYKAWCEAHIEAWDFIPNAMGKAGITKESNPDIFNVIDKVKNRQKVTRAEIVKVFGGETKANQISPVKTALKALGLAEEVDGGVLLAPKGLENTDVGFPDNLDEMGTPDYNPQGEKEKAQVEEAYSKFSTNIQPSTPDDGMTEKQIEDELDGILEGDNEGEFYDLESDFVPVAKIQGLVNALSPDNPLRAVWAEKLGDTPAPAPAPAPAPKKKNIRGKSEATATATATGTTDARPDATATAEEEEKEEEKEENEEAEAEEIQNLYGEQPPTVDVVPPPTVPAGPAEFTQDLPPVVNIPDEGPTTLPPGLRQEFIQEGDRSAPADLQTGMGDIGETIAQLNDKEQRDVMKMKLPEIKKRIEALHIAYDSLIPEFKANPHTKAKNDALRTKDLKVARKHLIKMLQRVQAYYDANTALKVGVIVPANVLMRQMFENQAMMQNPMMLQQQQQPMLQQEQQQTIEDEGGGAGEDQRRRLVDFQAFAQTFSGFMQNPQVQSMTGPMLAEMAKMGKKQLDAALKNAETGVKEAIMNRVKAYSGGSSTDPPTGTEGLKRSKSFRDYYGKSPTTPTTGKRKAGVNQNLIEYLYTKERSTDIPQDIIEGFINFTNEAELRDNLGLAYKLYSLGMSNDDVEYLRDAKTFKNPQTGATYKIDTANVQNVDKQINMVFNTPRQYRAAGTGGGGSGGIPMGAAAGMGMGGGMGMGASTVNQNVKPHAGDTLHVKGDKFGHAMSVSTYYRNSGMEAFQRRGVARHSITPQPEKRTRFNIVKDPRPLPNVPAPAIGVLNNRSRGKPTGFKIKT